MMKPSTIRRMQLLDIYDDVDLGDALLAGRVRKAQQRGVRLLWRGEAGQPPMYQYPAGSWGPPEADELLKRDGRDWRRL